MQTEEVKIAEKRKKNMRVYSVHRMLTADLLFYYGVKFLFLTQIKGITASQIVLASAFFGIFKVLFQIPMVAIVEKIGYKKGIILEDFLNIISVILIMLSNNLITLIIANLFGGVAYAIKEISENGMLNVSIPNGENKSEIFSKIDAKGLSKYYYISAISAIISGFLFDINGYIPMSICVLTLVIAMKVAFNFEMIETNNILKAQNIEYDIKDKYKKYFKDLKLAFSFIFNSRRLKALMLFSGIMYSVIMVMNTYEMGLLDEISASATSIGIIYASMQVIAGIASKKQEAFHNKFKNKTLAIIGISYTVACLVAGLTSLSAWPYIIVLAIVTFTYAIRYVGTGLYYVLIKKYITNFTNEEVASKVYSAYGLVTGLGSTIVCIIGAIISSNNNLKYSTIIFSATFLVIILLVLLYMKDRVGLEPNEYRKKDINYKAYVSLK